MATSSCLRLSDQRFVAWHDFLFLHVTHPASVLYPCMRIAYLNLSPPPARPHFLVLPRCSDDLSRNLEIHLCFAVQARAAGRQSIGKEANGDVLSL